MKRALVPASLLLLAACQQPGPRIQRPYSAAEEGLTLVYINPALPKDQQDARRLQVRVDRVTTRPDGASVVFKTFTVGVGQPFTSLFVLQGGGLGLLSPDGKSEAQILPKGFPDAENAWTSGTTDYRVIGRGAWLPGADVLPSDRPSEGTWVESRPQSGAAARTLYLPGLGEVQTDEQLPDGSWKTVNLLTQYGFTDLPSAPQPEAAPAPKKPAKRKR